MDLLLTRVTSRRDRRTFRRLPWRLYRDDPCWVAPLDRDVARLLDARRHPFYDQAEAAFFLARRGGRVVGRIAAIDNAAYNRHHGERVGFFGFFESEDDPETAAGLLDAAAGWLRSRGLDTLRGPVSPSTNYECGLRLEGEAGPPALMMAHNPPWYRELLEGAGLHKAMDLYAYVVDENCDGRRWERVSRKVRQRHGIEFRPLDLGDFRREVDRFTEIYHDAWSKNWGFAPMSQREIAHLARELRPLMLPFLSGFATRDGEDLGFYLALPDYNRVLIHLRGRLWPWGLFRLLRARRRLDTSRVLLLGVRRRYQRLGLDAVLYHNVWQNARAHGIPTGEASWILETNRAMINALERVGARRSRTYRIFERAL